MRELTYAKTLNETLKQILYRNDDVILIGQGVTSPWYVGSTTEGIVCEIITCTLTARCSSARRNGRLGFDHIWCTIPVQKASCFLFPNIVKG